MNKKILVTGGLGFIGSNLVDFLVRKKLRDDKVFVMDNHQSESSYYEYKNELVEKYIFDDVANISQYSKVLGEDIDIIFHLAANARIQPSFENPQQTVKNNILGTLAVCDYAKKHNAKKIVYAGSSSFYTGSKLSPYSFSKWVGEEVCDLYTQIYKIPTITARFFNVYGNRQPIQGDFATVIGIFERQIANGEDLTIYGDGEQKRDFTGIMDICRGLVDLWENDVTGIYNLGSGKSYTLNEIADFFIKYSKSESKKVYLPKRINEAQDALPADVEKTINDINWKAIWDIEMYIESLYRENE